MGESAFTDNLQAVPEMALVQRVTLAISEATDVRAALTVALEMLCRFTGWHYGEAWLPNNTANWLEYVAGYHDESDNHKEFYEQSRSLSFALGEGLPGNIWAGKQLIWIEEIAEDEKFVRKPLAAQAGLSTLVGIPVLAEREVVALLVFFSSETRSADERFVSLVTTVAAQLGSVIKWKRIEAERDRFFTLSFDLLAVTDFNGVPKRLNPAWQRMIGYTSDELMADTLLKLPHPDDLPACKNELKKLVGGFTLNGFECRVRCRDGSYRWIMFNAIPVVAERLIYIAGRDISRLKQDEEQLKATTAKLAANNQQLQEFAFIASHDLQEPLRKIRTFGDLLVASCAPALNDECRDYLARMQNAAFRMQKLVDGLLTLSRITTQARPFEKVSLSSIAEEVLSDLEVTIRNSGAQIEVGALPEIEADPLQIRQLMQNLIGNALKFHREGEPPVVKIAALPNDDVRQCRFIVSDEGIGFDEKYLERIFMPFQRLHGSVEYTGTGMGLAICKKIVERHGGTITANSNPGAGAVFTVTLPCVQQARGQNENRA